MNQQDEADDALAETAAAWWLRLRAPGCSAATRSAFGAWLAESPAHHAEIARFETLWGALGRLDYPDRARRKALRTATALALVCALGFGWLGWPVEERYLTAVGERCQLLLADGSQVTLDAGSELRTRYSGFSRRLELVRGAAYFRVTHERWRGFEVAAGAGVTRDIGTAFRIVADADMVRVAVTAGAVEVRHATDGAPVRLARGQALAYNAAGRSQVAAFDPAEVTAWQHGRLVFRDTPLAEIVAQLNRYHARPTRLADPAQAGLAVSGEFNSADRAGLLRALTLLLPVKAREVRDATVLVPRGEPG